MDRPKAPDAGEKGSVIVEATLVFPLVLLVMLAFCVLIRYFVVYETFQHGMYETTREMGAYYYLYAAAGLEKLSGDISQEAGRARENLDMLAEPLNDTINNMRSIASQLGSAKGTLGSLSANGAMHSVEDVQGAMDNLKGNADAIMSEADDMKGNLADSKASLQLVMESPLEALTYLLKTGVGQATTWAENSVMNLVARAFMGRHVPGGNVDDYARAYGIQNFKNAMCWNDGGSGNVEMVLTYLFRIRLFNGIDFQVIQKTTTKGWGLGV